LCIFALNFKAKKLGGIIAQVKRLRKEGFKIEDGKGKQPPRVKDFEKYLVEL
jgi:hypothetical protein